VQVNLDPAQAQQLAGQFITQYLAWCTANGQTPTDATALATFAGLDSTQQWLQGAVGSAVDLTQLQQQVQDVMQQYLQTLVSTYGSQIQAAVQATLQDALTSYEPQLQSWLEGKLSDYVQSAMSTVGTQLESTLEGKVQAAMQAAMGQLAGNMSSAMNVDPSAFKDAFSFNMSPDDLTQLMMTYMNKSQATESANLKKLGYADAAKPSGISIYPTDFAAKQQVIDILNGYNSQMNASGQTDKVITFTDIVGTLMSSVTNIINMITNVLIAFVSISLVVSSIMIGVITYISVLERKKEIGILRSIGASKRDIRRVFNAETLIVGLTAGLIAIVFVVLAAIPVNLLVNSLYNVPNVVDLPVVAGVALIAISMLLTFIAGLIPSSAAARKDPVEALRSE
jgi:ABC-type antimicrobial peptide transport system permease subunit